MIDEPGKGVHQMSKVKFHPSLKSRSLDLKGLSAPVQVRVMR
jgi:hypothetical protein